ncbi:MAG TPA: glycerate kinase, partial [Actinomycetales bacterium]|nr:glycerate kinase [Actinomycetales bacterium]
VVGLGGSATTDGGCGAAAACGVRFFDDDGAPFVPVGATLSRISRIDASGLDPEVARIAAMCDVDNPLTGEHGAAAVFGPQKGATPELVRSLDDGLAHLAQVVRRDLGVEVEDLPGAGAAGGLGGGMVAFFGAELRRGVDAVLDAVGFAQKLASADAVISGEGSFDSQSLRGKVVLGVSRRTREPGVPLHVLAGRVDPGVRDVLREHGIASARAITPEGMDLEEAMERAGELLSAAARDLAKDLA